jgi:hypothetical protein
MAFTFEKLQVYQKALEFADAVCTLTKSFPRGCFGTLPESPGLTSSGRRLDLRTRAAESAQ